MALTPKQKKRAAQAFNAATVPTHQEIKAVSKGGRPSSYSLALATSICERLSKGELLVDICEDDGMPSMSAIYRWQETQPGFREVYAHAREMQAHALAERAVKSGRAATAEDAAAARVKFDADRWLAARLAPKVYGDKVSHDHEGEVTILSPEQRRAKLSALMSKTVTTTTTVAIESTRGDK